MSQTHQPVTCTVCRASCADNGQGKPKEHYEGHVPKHDGDGNPILCSGGSN